MTRQEKTTTDMDLGELPEILGYLLRIAARASDRQVLPVLAANDFTRAELTTLMIIAYNPNHSLQEITAAVGVELPATQRHVNSLRKKGYIIQSRPAHDKRITHYQITPSGLEKAEQLKALANEKDRKLMTGLSEAEKQELFRLLRHVGTYTA
ncbi:MarR family transcriptional regulator [Pseudochrobactrum sp. sp1633]|uniref:MarR family winged helix-turn-helix transcriptional regulator n=1 Tax=Pseudochrobactrum sp. sp1633 TaxID=3036706 RepID=UPI0025A5C4AF|nr:MarR family transcriptional regulator [Pseudochrobactrum sp. sp1633]MDM8346299.1 MarR family transcriptional regulator [Pseudochrobactrum sp. sp1633]HWD14086.1 MarR family transcriptional regulator [Pseudochrobactrum sp.]